MIQINSTAGLLYDPRLTDPARRLFLVQAKMEIALNKTGAITVVIPAQNPLYGQLRQRTSEVWALQDGDELFRGYVREIHEDLDGLQEVVVEGLKGLLRDEQLRPYTPETYGGTVSGWLTMAVNTYNTQRSGTGAVPFALGTVDAQELAIEGADYKDILSAIDSDLLKAVGGYLFVIRSGGANVISWTKNSGPVDDQVIDYGVNLTAYKRDDSAADMFTAVIPLGKADGDNGKLTIKSVNGGSDVLIDSDAAAANGLIVKVINYNDIDDPTALKAAGEADLDAAGLMATSIEVSAVDLADAGVNVGRLRLGHQNYVRVVRGGPTQLLPISRISADLIDPDGGRYTFSQQYTTLTQQQSATSAVAAAAASVAANAATSQSVAQLIAQSEQKYAAYVSGTGSGSGWRWRIWSDGTIDADGVITVSMGSPSIYASGLQTATGTIALPFATADTGSTVICGVSDGSDGIASALQTSADELTVKMIAPSIGASYAVSIYLRGRAS